MKKWTMLLVGHASLTICVLGQATLPPTGAPGVKGAQGSKGSQGPTGATGPRGKVGTKGDLGRIGASGATGQQGPEGSPGASGIQGATGPQGPAGEPGAPAVLDPNILPVPDYILGLMAVYGFLILLIGVGLLLLIARRSACSQCRPAGSHDPAQGKQKDKQRKRQRKFEKPKESHNYEPNLSDTERPQTTTYEDLDVDDISPPTLYENITFKS